MNIFIYTSCCWKRIGFGCHWFLSVEFRHWWRWSL